MITAINEFREEYNSYYGHHDDDNCCFFFVVFVVVVGAGGGSVVLVMVLCKVSSSLSVGALGRLVLQVVSELLVCFDTVRTCVRHSDAGQEHE